MDIIEQGHKARKAPSADVRRGHDWWPKFCDLDKNIGHYPFARDSRRKVEWDEGTCDLPGEDRIELTTPDERLPSSFDFALMCLLIACAKKFKTLKIDLGSAKQVLKVLGYSYHSKNVALLRESIDYLSSLQITHRRWYVKDRKKRVAKELPPLIRRYDGLKVRLDPAWRPIIRSEYRVRLPFPLPRGATCQNLLLILRSSIMEKDEDGARVKPVIEAHKLCRKVGLAHAHRNRFLKDGIEELERYYKNRKGDLRCTWQKGTELVGLIVFKDIEIGRDRKPKVMRVPAEPQHLRDLRAARERNERRVSVKA